MLDISQPIMHQLSMTEQELRSTQHRESGRDPLRRTFLVLDWMARQPETQQGVREIAGALEMQASTVSRLLAQMADVGAVRRDEATGRYSLGLDLIRLGALAAAKLDVATTARPHMARLTELSGESSYLSVYDALRRRMMRVDTVPSPNPLRYVVAMNQWVDIVRGASGQAILAFLPHAEIDAAVAEALTSGVMAEPVLENLSQIRADGYACTSGQRTAGAVGIGAPIFDSRVRVIGDVFLTIPESRFDPGGQTALGSLVRETAERITAGIAGRWPREASLVSSVESSLS